MPLVSRTRATLRSAEFGFFGVWVNTRTQTPRFWGLSCSAGLLVLVMTFSRPFRTSWLIVGTVEPLHRARIRARENMKTPSLDKLGQARSLGRKRLDAPGLGSRVSGPAPAS